MTTRIRDIIDRPQPRSWEQRMCGVWAGDQPIAQWSGHIPDPDGVDQPDELVTLVRNHADFIATFDPEHVALMESVVEAAQHDTDTNLNHEPRQSRSAVHALNLYRRAHGLV